MLERHKCKLPCIANVAWIPCSKPTESQENGNCREEEEAAKAAATKQEAKRRKRDKAKGKAKAQQANPPAAPPPTAHTDTAPQPTLGHSNADQVMMGRSESNLSDIADVSTPQAFPQHSLEIETTQPEDSQRAPAQHDFQPGITPSKAPAVDMTIAQPVLAGAEVGLAGPADVMSASGKRSPQREAQQARPAARDNATEAGISLEERMLSRGHSQPEGDQGPAGSSETRAPSAVPQPGVNVARPLKGTPQQGLNPGHSRRRPATHRGRKAQEAAQQGRAANPQMGWVI